MTSPDDVKTQKRGCRYPATTARRVKRRIGLIADLHIASNFGLCPPDFEFTSGNVIRLNKGQKVLWDHWLSCLNTFRQQKVDTVIHDGDLTQGQNLAERGVALMTPDMDEQANMTHTVLEPLLQIPTLKRIHFIQGSAYHIGMKGLQIERRVQREINGKNGIKSKWWGLIANIKIEGTNHRAHIIHGSSASMIYRATNIDRKNLFMNAAAGIGKLPKFTILMRAHWHWSAYLHINSQHNIQIPCFCLFIPWQGGVEMYAKAQPDIGAMILTIYDDDHVDLEEYLLPDDKIPMHGHEVKSG